MGKNAIMQPLICMCASLKQHTEAYLRHCHSASQPPNMDLSRAVGRLLISEQQAMPGASKEERGPAVGRPER